MAPFLWLYNYIASCEQYYKETLLDPFSFIPYTEELAFFNTVDI